MEKNCIQKKRRIAHFQNAADNFTEMGNKTLSSESFDCVSKIIQNMDSNYDAFQTNFSKKYSNAKVTNMTVQNNCSVNYSTASSNTELPRNPKNFGRKFSTSRKFPLMEKSQKALRQLKHNRRIPKPRAHLAALPGSPVNVNKSGLNRKNKNVRNENKFHNSGLNSARSSISDNCTHNSQNVNNKESKISNYKTSKKPEKIVWKEGENIKSTNAYEHSASENLCASNMNTNIERNSFSDITASKDSGNETTDSEYERFVKESKKGLQKKVNKTQKQSVAKSKISCDKSKSKLRKNNRKRYNSDESNCIVDKSKSRTRNRIRKTYSGEDDSSDDNTSLSTSGSSRKMSSFKKRKSTPKAPVKIVSDRSESDTIPNDASIPDSSSESDIVDNEESKTDRILLSNTEAASSEVQKADMRKENISETCYYITNNVAPSVDIPRPSSLHVNTDNVVPNVDRPSSHVNDSVDTDKTELNNHTPNLVIDLCDSEDDCNELSTVSNSVEQQRSACDDIIQLGESNCINDTFEERTLLAPKEEKCTLTNVPQTVIHPDSEESDLEIIEVITKCPPNIECITDKSALMYDKIKNGANDSENDIFSNAGSSSPMIVKTEKLSDKADYEENQISRPVDAVYVTDICNEFSQDTLIRQNESEYTKSLETSSKDGVPMKVIKRENESDDDIIILGDVHTPVTDYGSASNFLSGKKTKTEVPNSFVDPLECASFAAHKILKMETENGSQHQSFSGVGNGGSKNANASIASLEDKYVGSKMKNTLAEKESDMHEVICSNSTSCSLNFSENKEFKELEQVDKSLLIKIYRAEMQTYEKILQMEANIGASFKRLENDQAEKVKRIQSLVQRIMEGETTSKYSTLLKNEFGSFKRMPEFSVKHLTEETGSEEIKPFFGKGEFLGDPPPSSSAFLSETAASKMDIDIKPNLFSFEELKNLQLLEPVIPKSEPELSRDCSSPQCQSDKKQMPILLNKTCNACGKEAVAACQNCAKVFFCSHECGRKFWKDGHVNECGQ